MSVAFSLGTSNLPLWAAVGSNRSDKTVERSMSKLLVLVWITSIIEKLDLLLITSIIEKLGFEKCVHTFFSLQSGIA